MARRIRLPVVAAVRNRGARGRPPLVGRSPMSAIALYWLFSSSVQRINKYRCMDELNSQHSPSWRRAQSHGLSRRSGSDACWPWRRPPGGRAPRRDLGLAASAVARAARCGRGVARRSRRRALGLGPPRRDHAHLGHGREPQQRPRPPPRRPSRLARAYPGRLARLSQSSCVRPRHARRPQSAGSGRTERVSAGAPPHAAPRRSLPHQRPPRRVLPGRSGRPRASVATLPRAIRPARSAPGSTAAVRRCCR